MNKILKAVLEDGRLNKDKKSGSTSVSRSDDLLCALRNDMKQCEKMCNFNKENFLIAKDYHRVDVEEKEGLMYGMFAEKLDEIIGT
jgi:hypothetical protein